MVKSYWLLASMPYRENHAEDKALVGITCPTGHECSEDLGRENQIVKFLWEHFQTLAISDGKDAAIREKINYFYSLSTQHLAKFVKF